MGFVAVVFNFKFNQIFHCILLLLFCWLADLSPQEFIIKLKSKEVFYIIRTVIHNVNFFLMWGLRPPNPLLEAVYLVNVGGWR